MWELPKSRLLFILEDLAPAARLSIASDAARQLMTETHGLWNDQDFEAGFHDMEQLPVLVYAAIPTARNKHPSCCLLQDLEPWLPNPKNDNEDCKYFTDHSPYVM